MLIRRKISLLFVLIIFLILMSNIIATSLIIRSTYEAELQSLRENELEKIKAELKDFVDITYEVAHTSYEKSADPQQIQQMYGDDLIHIIEAAESITDRYIELVRQGSLSTPAAQRRAMDDIRAMRYDSGTGYIWINDTGKPYPRMIMHPTAPHLNGEILDNPSFFCALGRDENLFKAFVDVCEEDGEGFVDYLWPKPTENGLTEEQPKLSYVRLIEEWDWIIGTGIYVDDARQAAETETLNVIRNMRYDDGVGYFFINNTERPFPRMIMHPTVPELDGQILDDPKYNCPMCQASCRLKKKLGGNYEVWKISD